MDNIDYKNMYRSHDIKVAAVILGGFLLTFLLVYAYFSMDAITMDRMLKEGRYDMAVASYNEVIVDEPIQRGIASVCLRMEIQSIVSDYEKREMSYGEAAEALMFIAQAENAGVSERALAALEELG